MPSPISGGGLGVDAGQLEYDMFVMRQEAAERHTSTVFFKPRTGQDRTSYDQFVHALSGPRNELLHALYAQSSRAGRDGTAASSLPPKSACLHVLVSMHVRVQASFV